MTKKEIQDKILELITELETVTGNEVSYIIIERPANINAVGEYISSPIARLDFRYKYKKGGINENIQNNNIKTNKKRTYRSLA